MSLTRLTLYWPLKDEIIVRIVDIDTTTIVLCAVPFCPRHKARTPTGEAEWICDEHWRLVPAEMRRVYHARQKHAEHSRDPKQRSHIVGAVERMWGSVKVAAIEAAFGLR